MLAAFRENLIEEIKTRVDIIDLISEYVPLKRRGQNYVGLCPFHTEKTPSFTVSPSKQLFYCFGCGVGGDAFTFLMKREGLNFSEALTRLAERVGINLEEGEGAGIFKLRREKERLYQIGALAARFYHLILLRHPTAAQAREYLQRRRVSLEAVRKFELGYAPDSPRALVDYLKRHGFHPREIALAGLAASRAPEGSFDRFRRRLMFPVKDPAGKVIGFGGRALDNSEPKYLNTPETPLFRKGHHLYGLHLAVAGIRRRGKAVVVEGYLDAISAWQHGVDNVVATLGTALTIEQARALKRYTEEVIIAYDADAAGRAAALRVLGVLADMGLRVRVLLLPEGKDPDEFLQRQGGQAFQKLVEEAPPWLVYIIEQVAQSYNLADPSECVKAIQKIIPYLAKIEDAVERDNYVRILSRRTGQLETAIYEELHKFRARQMGRPRRLILDGDIRDSQGTAVTTFQGPEVYLLCAYLASEEWADRIEASLGPAFWSLPQAGIIASAAKELREEYPGLEGEDFQDKLSKKLPPDALPLLARVALKEGQEPLEPKALEQAIKSIQLKKWEDEMQACRRSLSLAEAAGREDEVKALQTRILDLARNIKNLKAGRGET
ncbi:DNA primase [Thermanaeromonas toyohensis ToBE]|uniref:DNA primase n=1 Tax=Thermanaeromonas toyohensis ToBE TaxID=698762 RepID=A0A1W1VI27_9FIRM|nr:DNA primase [Thermanaeromonas toyohensis]SMB93035.1 DNA primase [Thermanaeromonas toyohensis ToBE]